MTSDAGFCGIDPDEMGRVAESLRRSAANLAASCREFDTKFRQTGVSTSVLQEIADIADWGGKQVSMLQGRIELINALGKGAQEPAAAGGSASSLLHLPDQIEDFETARGLATMFNQDIFTTKYSGEFQGQLIHNHTGRVAQLANNPQAAAAFFAFLSPQVRDTLPNLIATTGSKTAKQDLAAFSSALGAALRAPNHIPAFTKVREALVKPTHDKQVAWQRLALLRGANVPSDVRSAAARSLVLDDFMRNPKQNWHTSGFTQLKAYGLPSDLVVLGLEVLGDDGTAVRDAFAKAGGADLKIGQVDKMKRLFDYGRTGGESIGDVFGRVLVAGSEATEEKAGHHSPAAAAFALDTLLAAGSFGATLPRSAKDSMGVIANSYVHELLSGGRTDKATDRISGMNAPKHWIDWPGVTPAFYLSPGDTYRFFKTFAGEDRAVDEFNKTVAGLRHDLLISAARLDAKGKTDYFRGLSTTFGDLGSIQFKATKEVLGEEDAVAGLARDVTKNSFALLLDGVPIVGKAAELGWALVQAYVVSTASDAWADSFETQVEAADKKQSDVSRRMMYDMAYLLHAGGYPASDPPKELVNPVTGNLKTYEELTTEARQEAKNGQQWEQALQRKLNAYEAWMDKNRDLDDKIEYSSRAHTSNLAEHRLQNSD
ncbi:hypothetical protein [Sinosporangium siamense]|uniref:Uncharacterized protein n=1 Tax=Sinosporangium siamense TaxID=1367973 RepID=A0A919RG87_9ACTN|nr:hypothetical protein [Sinosporangium siamense]GII91829.1 hypothetical protein Ssi02_20600 [Sinosporangium siamense]